MRAFIFSRKNILTAFLFVFANTLTVASASSVVIGAENFINGAKYLSMTVSPSGDFVAALENVDGYYQTRVLDVNKKYWSLREGAQAKTNDLFNRWIDDQRLLVLQSDLENKRQLLVYDAKKDSLSAVFSFGPKDVVDYIGTSIDKNHLYISGSGFYQGALPDAVRDNSVFRVSLDNGAIELWVPDLHGVDRWYSDDEASYWLGHKYEDKINTIYSYSLDNKEYRRVHEAPLARYPDILPITVDSARARAYFLLSHESDTNEIHEYDLVDERFIGKVFGDQNYDLTNQVLLSHQRSRLLAVHYQAERGKNIFYDSGLEKKLQGLDKYFGEDAVKVVSTDRELVQVVLYVYGARNPGLYYLYNTQTGKVYILGENVPGFSRSGLRKTVPVSFRARDGEELPAYVTLPRGYRASAALPLVVLVNGSVYGRDVWEYNPQLQFLVNRGYAILQVNSRSSSGYGLNHFFSGVGSSSANQVNDIVDGVEWALDKFSLDKNNVSIVGSGVGGYRVLRTLVSAPDMFRSAVIISGFGDLAALLKDHDELEDNSWLVGTAAQAEFSEAFINASDSSPLDQIADVSSALMLVHGRENAYIGFDHAKQIERSLKKNDKTYETLYFRGEGHTFQKPKNKIRVLDALHGFLSKHAHSE